jgi:hypothetical protein
LLLAVAENHSVLIGVALILAGLGLLLTARTYRDEAGRFARWRLEGMQARRAQRLVIRLAELNARWGVAGTVWLGRLLGVAAIAVGVVLVIRG